MTRLSLSVVALALIVGVHSWTRTDFPGQLARSSAKDPSRNNIYLWAGPWTNASRFEGSMPEKNKYYYPVLVWQKRELKCTNFDGFARPIEDCGILVERLGQSRLSLLDQDCELDEWGPWEQRHDGAFVRRRNIITYPQGAGKECDLLVEVTPATVDTTAHWVPGSWGPCKVAAEGPSTSYPRPSSSPDPSKPIRNKERDAIYEDAIDYSDYKNSDNDEYDDSKENTIVQCGGGIEKRQATCVSGDGRELHPMLCAHVSKPTLVQPCEVPCPRDCKVGEWSEWGACQPADGCPLFPVQQLTTIGYSVRKRRVISAASGGGASCPPLEEKRTCSTPRCASWQNLPWGPCVLFEPHSNCGPGKRTRELRCVGHDGKEAQKAWCSGTSTPSRSEHCRIACPGDCVVSAWGPWSACSDSCAAPGLPPPSRTRRRHILAHASPSGWPCPTPEQLVQRETCNTHACATYSWLTTPWGPCERRSDDYVPSSNYTDFLDSDTVSDSEENEPCIEEGEMTRDVVCVQNNADVVRDAMCAPLKRPATRRACTVRCVRGCNLEPWQPWSECPDQCERAAGSLPAQQIRIRKVHGGSCGTTQEVRPCRQPAFCKQIRPEWQTGPWSACTSRLDPGYRYRRIWCGTRDYVMGSARCAGQPLPHNVAPCTVPVKPTPRVTCEQICARPLKYLDESRPDIPSTCQCSNVTIEVLPQESSCILQRGMECGVGKILKLARCLSYGIHVPMAVCKKYRQLEGNYKVEVIHDPSTAGLRYDSEFFGLLQSECSISCARDCVLGSWGEWGPCAAEAGSLAAFRFRTREVIQEASLGGRECGATLQRSSCSLSPPRWLIGEWSTCQPRNSICGRAIINRTVVCVDADGKHLDESSCDGEAGPVPPREAACRAPCPGDCVVSAWSDWSPCLQTKWGGRRDRTRVALRAAAEGGAACPPLVGASPCASYQYSWHVAPWDDCRPLGRSSCGEGMKRRSVRCLRSDGVFVDESLCPNATNREPAESWCYVPCGVDCELAEWAEWDASACACQEHPGDSRDAYMRRSRQILTAPVWPGRECAETEQRVPCPAEPCLKPVSNQLPGCSMKPHSGPEEYVYCGWGVRVTHNSCQLPAAAEAERLGLEATLHPRYCAPQRPGRVAVPPPEVQEETCEIKCECREQIEHLGPWQKWGPCKLGTRSRIRQMLLPKDPRCPSLQKSYGIEWSNCSDDGVDPNSRVIPRTPDVVVKKALKAHDEKPRAFVDGDDDYDALFDQESYGSWHVAEWLATLIVSFLISYAIYKAIVSYVKSKYPKKITKV